MNIQTEKLKILWVNAVNEKYEVERRYQPLGIFHIMAQLKIRFGPDALEFKIVDSSLNNELLSFRPHIVAISSVTQNYNIAKKYASMAKAFACLVVIGGVHISSLPSTMTEDMDIGIIGEGEFSFGDVAEWFLNRENKDSSSLASIPGLVYWEDDRLQYSLTRQAISELDLLAHPDRSLMNSYTRWNVMSSRGCPFHCSFCSSSQHWGSYRPFSPSYVCEEVRRVLSFTDKGIVRFWDDLFTSSHKRLNAIYAELDSNNLLGKFKFACTVRANLLTEDTVKLLKEMGCVSVGIGLESGNEEILKYLKGKDISIQDNKLAIDLFKKYGIEVSGAFVIGCPTETKEQIADTYNFIRSSKLDFFDTFLLTPLPGTQIWRNAKDRGIVSDEMDWDSLNFRFHDSFEKSVIVSENLSRGELIDLYKKFKRLRWLFLAKNLWKSPHLFKLPGILLGSIKEKLYLILRLN